MESDLPPLARLWPNREHESNWLKALICALGFHRWHTLTIRQLGFRFLPPLPGGEAARVPLERPAELRSIRYLVSSPPDSIIQSCRPFLRDNRFVEEIVTREPEVTHGTPVFRGNRIPVQTRFDHLENGDSLDEFLEGLLTISRATRHPSPGAV